MSCHDSRTLVIWFLGHSTLGVPAGIKDNKRVEGDEYVVIAVFKMWERQNSNGWLAHGSGNEIKIRHGG